MNSYGFNGEIPTGAIAAEYDMANGEFTGKFFFAEQETENYGGNHEIIPVFGIYQPGYDEQIQFERLYLDFHEAIRYAESGAEEGNVRHVVKNLLTDAIEFEFGENIAS